METLPRKDEKISPFVLQLAHFQELGKETDDNKMHLQ